MRIEASPLPGRFGQGFPGMLYLPTVTYLGPMQDPGSKEISEQAFFRDLLRAHEVAHQWWGNIITSGSYHHEWIMESLSNYSALMFMESRIGPRALDTALNSYRHQLFTKGIDGSETEAEGPVVQGGRLQNSNNPAATNAVVYGKGTWIIHMLRRRLGDEQFLKMLAALRNRYEWKPVETDDLRKLVRRVFTEGISGREPDGILRPVGVQHRSADAEDDIFGERHETDRNFDANGRARGTQHSSADRNPDWQSEASGEDCPQQF